MTTPDPSTPPPAGLPARELTGLALLTAGVCGVLALLATVDWRLAAAAVAVGSAIAGYLLTTSEV